MDCLKSAWIVVALATGCAAGSDSGQTTGFTSYNPSASAGVTTDETAGTTDSGSSGGTATDSDSASASTSEGSTSGAPTTTTETTETGAAECGNGLIEAGEVCDGAALDGASCDDFGFQNGDVVCSSSCTLVTDGCYTCGDGTKDELEVCDGNDFGGETCVSLGFGGGTLVCSPACQAIGTASCTPLASCGDDLLNGNEQCEGQNFGGASCQTLGFDSGVLACTGTCTYDTSGCMNDEMNCAGQGEVCVFDENDPQSNCCGPGVKGNILGICDIIFCI